MPAPRCRRTILTLCLTLLAIAPFSLASAEEPELWKKQEKRLMQEATALFKVILGKLNRERKQCELPDEWRSESVPYFVAKHYLSHTTHADLRALRVEATTAEILDPAGKYPESYCSQDEFDKEQKTRDDYFGSGKIVPDVKYSDRYNMYRVDYTFPIFDKNYWTAVVMVESSSNDWYRTKSGQVQQRFGQQGGAWIYRKKYGRWQLFKYKPFFHTHGAYKPLPLASLPWPSATRAKLRPITPADGFTLAP